MPKQLQLYEQGIHSASAFTATLAPQAVLPVTVETVAQAMKLLHTAIELMQEDGGQTMGAQLVSSIGIRAARKSFFQLSSR